MDEQIIEDLDTSIPVNLIEFTEEELLEREQWAKDHIDYTYNRVVEARRIAYQTEADPLFFKWQAGIATKQEWLDARAAVDAANPYPESVN